MRCSAGPAWNSSSGKRGRIFQAQGGSENHDRILLVTERGIGAQNPSLVGQSDDDRDQQEFCQGERYRSCGACFTFREPRGRCGHLAAGVQERVLLEYGQPRAGRSNVLCSCVAQIDSPEHSDHCLRKNVASFWRQRDLEILRQFIRWASRVPAPDIAVATFELHVVDQP